MQGSWISPIPTVQGLIEDELLVQHVEAMFYEGHRGMMTEGPLRGALTGAPWPGGRNRQGFLDVA